MSRGFKGSLLVIAAVIAVCTVGGLQNFKAATARSLLGRTRSDPRTLGSAIESYQSDHQRLPPMVPMINWIRPTDSARAALEAIGGISVAAPDLRPYDPRYSTKDTDMTNAVGSRHLKDGVNIPFAYATDGNSWIVYAGGPDGDWDITKPLDGTPLYQDAWEISHPNLVYDPTNGVFSSGDMVRLKARPPPALPSTASPPSSPP